MLDPLATQARAAADYLERRNISLYVSVAKLGLWLTSLVLLLVVVTCSFIVVLEGDATQISNVVGAAQALTVIALSVLGFHGYQGSRALHILRHISVKPNILDEALPEPDGTIDGGSI
jgi:hypothetical protein